jgi:hypothetical protein
MNREVLNKIIQKAKALDFEVSRGYHQQRVSPVVYKQEICSVKGYENGYFLIHENIILGNTIENSSYDIFEFDLNGNFVGQIEVDLLPSDFFKNRKPIHQLK